MFFSCCYFPKYDNSVSSVVLQETLAGPVPGMHSVESVEAEQRRWHIVSVISRL